MLQPLGQQVDRDHPARSKHLGLGQVHQPQRPEAEHRNGVAHPEAAAECGHRARGVEAVGDGQHLGQRGHVGGQVVGDAEQARAGKQIHQLRPAAEQVRRLGAGERVAVVLERRAEVVGIALAETEAAPPAGQVWRRHHPVADRQRPAQLVDRRRPIAQRFDHAHVLVPADDRVGDSALVVGSGVLQALAAPGVLIGAADAAVEHPQHRGARPGVGFREALDREPSRPVHHGCAHIAHPGGRYR